MMAYLLILLPLAAAALALAIPSNRLRPWLLPPIAATHTVLLGIVLARPELAKVSEELVLDPMGKVVLASISVLFLLCSFYSVGYLKYRDERSNRVFVACLLAFLGLISLVAWSHHLGLMWVAIEGTTLVSAPLIYFKHSKLSIEATWKYLLVGSVGIALALLGTFFLAYSSMRNGMEATLALSDLLARGPSLSKRWLHASFILLLVGYGTKMGLAPMHTWKPDAYGEAPGVVGAILAGGVTSGAFLALTRAYQICVASGEGAFSSRLLMFMGLFSIAVAGLFMIGQKDFKRMLAYSSVEHMGILALGLGIGGPALFATVLHVVTNSMTKGALFLSAGNIHRSFASKNTDTVSGAIRRLPLSGSIFLAGFLAITGSPPFGPFISEFGILNGAFSSGHFLAAGLFLFFLLVVFIGMGRTVLKVTQGEVPENLAETSYKDDFLMAAPTLAFLLIALILGLYIPEPARQLLADAAALLENRL
ncbi:MAG: proton-conducting transporter membrane subunit [Treponemataceae bacterium]